jgi:hypothetical protein
VSRELGKIHYNNILTDYRFYEAIPATYLLTVQMDNYFRKKIPDEMFVGDYWGNPLAWVPYKAGGGATVRKVSAMIALCKEHRPNLSLLI